MLLADTDAVCHRLLMSAESDATTGLSSTSCLHLAARNGHTAIVRSLSLSLSLSLTLHAGWLGGTVVMAWDSQSRGREFNSRPFHYQVKTLGKMFTPMCLCHQAVQFGTGKGAVMLCGWECSHRSGVALAMRLRLGGLSQGSDTRVRTQKTRWVFGYTYLKNPPPKNHTCTLT